MLQTNTVYPGTLDVLKKIMQSDIFSSFTLVGGTALSLQIGHRISEDLDLFSYEPFDNQELITYCENLGDVKIASLSPNFSRLWVKGAKLDIVKYPYSFVNEYILIDNIRLLPPEKILVMKLLAIGNRGVKKDFFDFYFFLQSYTVKECIAFFENTFPNVSTFHILKSLTYFEDAENQEDPIMIKDLEWERVKLAITEKVNQYLSEI